MKKLIAFHGKPEIKEAKLAQLRAHYEADEIIQGTYWEDGKGCAVGCSVHSSDHFAYETEMGIPVMLAKLEDRIFEGLSNEEAKEFPIQFIEAIPISADLSNVGWQLLIEILKSVRGYADKVEVIDNVIDLLQRKIDGENIDVEEFKKAKCAAVDADAADADADADAAAYAADAADAVAYAAVDADADAAAAAAYAASAAAAAAAAYAAADADADAVAYARRQAYSNYKNILLELLAKAPVEQLV